MNKIIFLILTAGLSLSALGNTNDSDKKGLVGVIESLKKYVSENKQNVSAHKNIIKKVRIWGHWIDSRTGEWYDIKRSKVDKDYRIKKKYRKAKLWIDLITTEPLQGQLNVLLNSSNYERLPLVSLILIGEPLTSYKPAINDSVDQSFRDFSYFGTNVDFSGEELDKEFHPMSDIFRYKSDPFIVDDYVNEKSHRSHYSVLIYKTEPNQTRKKLIFYNDGIFASEPIYSKATRDKKKSLGEKVSNLLDTSEKKKKSDINFERFTLDQFRYTRYGPYADEFE